jgi:predicted NAD/FAD-dependent oxidoreductase
MQRVAIVGAGAAGLAAAYRLRDAPVETVTFEKSDALTGRAATRTRDGFVYDYGANYLKADDPTVNQLVTDDLAEGLVDVTEPVYTFDGQGRIEPGRDADEHKWTYREGLHTLGSHLVSAIDDTVERGTRVTALERDGDQWLVHLEESSTAEPVRGPFDAVLLTPPAPQTAEILRASRWDDKRRTDIADAAATIPYRTICTVVAAYDRPIDRRWYALVNTDREHELGWVAREACKPGHVPEGKSLLVIQPSPDWSERHSDSPDAAAVEKALDLTADLLDDPDRPKVNGSGGEQGHPEWTRPEWTDDKLWRYALPDEGLADEQRGFTRDAGLYLAGDWVAGKARLHAALRSGLDVSADIMDRFGAGS